MSNSYNCQLKINELMLHVISMHQVAMIVNEWIINFYEFDKQINW